MRQICNYKTVEFPASAVADRVDRYVQMFRVSKPNTSYVITVVFSYYSGLGGVGYHFKEYELTIDEYLYFKKRLGKPDSYERTAKGLLEQFSRCRNAKNI